MYDARFQVGVHALVALAVWDRPTSSRTLSYSIETNPVVIRQVVGDLVDDGLVSSRRGPGGGYELAGEPHAISLLDAYRALGEGPVFEPYEEYPAADCPVGSRMPGVLDAALARAEAAMERWLDAVTVDDLVRDVRRDADRPGSLAETMAAMTAERDGVAEH